MSLRRRNRPSLIVSIAFMAGWFLSNDCFASGGVNIDDAIKATYSRLQLRFIFLNSQLDKIPLKQRPASLQAEYLGLRSSFHKLATAIQDQDSDLFNELSEMEDKLPAYQSDLYFLVKTIAPEKVASGLGGDPGNIDGFNHDSDGDDDFVLFHNKKTRVAVFTFDDPDRTGLGDSISFLLAKKLLYSALVSSFAVVNYSQGAERDQMGSYFDKVDLLTRDQGFLFALWGRISKINGGVHIDSFLQAQVELPQEIPYVRAVRLPAAMGGGSLIAQLNPSRIPLQSFDITDEDARGIKEAAANLAILRAKPESKSSAVARMAKDKQYTLLEKQGPWVRVEASNGLSGWTSVDQFCLERCAQLLDAAVFTDDLVARISGRESAPVPEILTRDAAAFSDQLTAILAIPSDPEKAMGITHGSKIVAPGPNGSTGESALPPWAGGFANLFAVAQVGAALKAAKREQPDFEKVRLQNEFIRGVANDLAAASVAYPSDLTILDNLALLYAYLGDQKRRDLALSIATGIRARRND